MLGNERPCRIPGMSDTPDPTRDEAAARDDSRAERDAPEEQTTSAAETTPEGKVFIGTGFFWGLVLGLILATLVIILAAQNTASITVRFLGWEISTPLIVLILGSLLIGVVLDEVAGAIYRRRKRRILNEREELKRLRGEVGR
jgi:uncharacterized integral membrane protein